MKCDIIKPAKDKVSQLRKSLNVELTSTTKTAVLKEIDTRIGTLSNPSKMPGHAWSISAALCITGSKLRKVPGTPCFHCYAHKGHYPMNNVQDAMSQRLSGWRHNSDWSLLMAIRLLLHNEEHFRWFDSGDLQSLKMLEDINNVAIHTRGYMEHFLPTQERRIVAQLSACAPNLIIRISGAKIDSIVKPKIKGALSSSVYSDLGILDDEHACPAKEQGNKCQSCRACWDKEVEHIVFPLH